MKIICIGRNYADHAKELNNNIPTEPVLFLKPETALLLKRHPFFIPDFSNDVHYEIELVVKINRLGKHIEERFAHKYYNEISVGLDFTARDLQATLKEKKLPWERAKAFDGSAAVGKFVDKNKFKDIQDINFKLEQNGQVVQDGHTKNMLFTVNQIIAEASKYFTLKIGDLIYTGTPAGVGSVKPNDHLKGFIDSDLLLNINVK